MVRPRIRWTCSDRAGHEHRTKLGAWLCGRLQSLAARTLAGGALVNDDRGRTVEGPATVLEYPERAADINPEVKRYVAMELFDASLPGGGIPVIRASDYDALAAKVQALEGENEVLREQNFEMNKALVDKAAEKMPHSFVNIRWACGHEGQAACLQCYQQACRDLEAARRERDEARSLHARLANSTGYLVDRIKRLEALVREMAREGGQAPTAEKEIARIAAETRTPQAGEEG